LNCLAPVVIDPLIIGTWTVENISVTKKTLAGGHFLSGHESIQPKENDGQNLAWICDRSLQEMLLLLPMIPDKKKRKATRLKIKQKTKAITDL
jgi:hypothetical protein